jgi:hypothetical protein
MKANMYTLARELDEAASTLFNYFSALKHAGFTDAQAFALVRDMARAGAASA